MASKPSSPDDQIRELRNKKSNRYCFDCNTIGLQPSVNLTIGTFVCTKCSGLLRKLNHKIRTINMSTFTQDEVNTLVSMGNKKARSIFFGRWNKVSMVSYSSNISDYLMQRTEEAHSHYKITQQQMIQHLNQLIQQLQNANTNLLSNGITSTSLSNTTNNDGIDFTAAISSAVPATQSGKISRKASDIITLCLCLCL